MSFVVKHRPTTALLAVVIFGAVLSIGAVTSTGPRPGSHGAGPVPHILNACQFSTSSVFDTQWSVTTPPEEVSVHGLDYPVSDLGFYHHLSAADYSTGDYFLLDNIGGSNFALDLYDSSGSLLEVVDSSGTVIAVGSNYLFYLGPYANGTLLTLPSLNLSFSSPPTTLPAISESPTLALIDQALSCTPGVPGTPTPYAAVPENNSATFGWSAPVDTGSSSIGSYSVYVNDVTNSSDPTNGTVQTFASWSQVDGYDVVSITGLTNGDTYTFSVAATNSAGTGDYSDPSPQQVIPGQTPLAAPTGVTAQGGDQFVDVTFDTVDVPDQGTTPIVEYSITGTDATNSANDVTSDCAAVVAASSQSCSVPHVTVGDSYTFSVQAINAEGAGPSSSPSTSVTVFAWPFDDPIGATVSGINAWFADYEGGPDGDGFVTELNTFTNSATEIDATQFDNPQAISSDGTHVWVADASGGSTNEGSVIELDASGNFIREIDSPDFSDPDAISSDGTDVWVANVHGGTNGTGSVVEIDVASGAIVQQINSLDFVNPSGISSDGTNVWVANEYDGTSGVGSVTEIDAATGTQLTAITSADFANPSAISSDGTDIWVANSTGGSGTGSVVELNSSGVEVRNITSSIFDLPVALSSDGSDVWVANYSGGGGQGNILEIDIPSGSVSVVSAGTVDEPRGIAAESGEVAFDDESGGAHGIGDGDAMTTFIEPSTPTITNIPAEAFVGGSYNATVSTDSPGVTSVTSFTTSVCTANVLAVEFVRSGTCTLQASVAPSGAWGAAAGTNQSFTVTPSGGGVATTTTSTTTTTTSTTTTTLKPTTNTTLKPPTTTTTTTLAPPASTTTTLSQPGTTTTTTTLPSPATGSPTTTPPNSSGSTGAPSTTTNSTTTTAPPPATAATIAFCGAPGVSLKHCTLTIQGQGLAPSSTVTVVVHSAPDRVGSTTVQSDGKFDVAASLPPNLAVGVHHVIVTGTNSNGSPFSEVEVFTVIKGERLGSIGWVPPTPLAGDVQFVASYHRTVILAATAGVTAAAAAVASGLGGGLALGGGGSVPLGGGSPGGSKGPGGGTLEDVELERLEGDTREVGPGDRSRFWRWPGTSFLDRWSKSFPHRAAAVSPVAGRVIIDGDYLRAMMGSVWLGLCLASIGLGAYASASSGWYAVPPSLGLFLVILALGVFDSMLGLLAGASFILCSLFAGHLSSAPELRLSMGLALVWFAVPLAAAALRPLRRTVTLKLDALWERVADLVVCGLFAAWVAEKMTSALSGLSGVELPINHDVGTIVGAVMALVAVRIIVETVVAHYFPGRLAAVRHEGELKSGKLQRTLSLFAQIVVFVFISSAIFGGSWALYVGTAVFFTPLVLELFEEKVPKSPTVTRWKPNGIVTWTIIIGTGVLLGELLKRTVHSGHLVEEIGFIVLPIPVLVFWTLKVFELREERSEEKADEKARTRATGQGGPNEYADASAATQVARARRTVTSANDVAGQDGSLSGRSRTKRRATATAPTATIVAERAAPMRTSRAVKKVAKPAPETARDAEVSTSTRRPAHTRAVKVVDEPTRSARWSPSSAVRTWLVRFAGVMLVAVSVLLVHFQGGG